MEAKSERRSGRSGKRDEFAAWIKEYYEPHKSAPVTREELVEALRRLIDAMEAG